MIFVMEALRTKYAHDIVKRICDEVRNSGTFVIIVDSTQYVSGAEQESVCLRYVDASLEPYEKFIGMYEPPETSGSTEAACIRDVLLCLNLSMAMLCVQIQFGCQATVKLTVLS